MPPSTDLLCAQCANINFEFFAKRQQKDEDHETLPNIYWSSFSPENCQICQLLIHCIENSGDKVFSQETLRGIYAGHELQLQIENEKMSRRLDYSIQQCEPILSSCTKEGYQVITSFDVNELKRWLKQCDTVHQCLPHNESQKHLPAGFRLIDVKKYRIVRPKHHVKFCALSYVWGNRVQPSLRLCNIKKFESKSKRFLKKQDLPRTIVDAMALCRDIGCRYLWVDSLCIIQDSKENKYSQINSMAEIYSQSLLSFIATAGDDSDAGLSPYRGRNSNISCLLRRNSKGSFVATLSPQIAAQQITKSAWASRGWTLQEYALSRRALFFTGSYVFLRCENELQFENFGLGFPNHFREDPRWDLPLPPFYRRTPTLNRHYPSTFSQLLAQLVCRRFSFESDILDAFTGILTRLEGGGDRNDGIGIHIWGLPSREFGAALQWITHAPWPSNERIGFPSYSWAGWFHIHDSIPPFKGFHDMYDGWFDNQVADMSVLTWYKYHDDKSIHIFGKCDFRSQLSKVKRKKYCYDEEEISRIEIELYRYFTPQPYEDLATFVKQTSFLKPPLSQILVRSIIVQDF